MSERVLVVTTNAELADTMQAGENATVEVRGALKSAVSLRLQPGQKLRGTPEASIRFDPGCDGVALTNDNAVESIEIWTDPDRRALYNDTNVAGFGKLQLHHLRVTGCVRIIAEEIAVGGHLDARNVHVVEADARNFGPRPAGFGVEVINGAFTLWNRQPSQDCRVTAELRGIAAGNAKTPVRGTGILVAGKPGGGGIHVSLLETGEVYSDGGIAPGTPDRISGGVFILQGTDADEVRNLGAVTTYGPNDMVLDNWGRVERWHAYGKITSHGPSGIGFVNLGQLGELSINALLETHGPGACGFNSGEVKQPSANEPTESAVATERVSDVAGAVRQAKFERVVTRGDGAIGIQVSVPIGSVIVKKGIETFGGVGSSLARGVVTKLAAVALSLKPGGSARELLVEGGLRTNGKGIEAMELHGQIDAIHISGGTGPVGGGFAVA